MRKKQHKKSASIAMSAGKKRLFTIMAITIPVMFFVMLELGLRIFHYGGSIDLFVSTPDKSSPYYGINTDVGKRFFHQGDFNPTPRKDLFLKKKPQNGYRIFVLGSSTAAGFPYGNNVTFSRILNRRLSDIFPERRIEVVNTAMTAINSYALLDFMDEILQQQPDALLIYAGHNEYYGALGVASMESLGKTRWIVLTFLKLERFKIFRLLQNTVAAVHGSMSGSKEYRMNDDPLQTEMSRIVREKQIPYHGTLYEQGIKQFRLNLHDILKKAARAGIPVLIGELVSNVRDQKPFVSMAADTLPSADEIFTTARDCEIRADYTRARTLYYRAKDLDALRFRASEQFNNVIHELAGRFGIAVVPMKAIFENASENGLIGGELMLEHLHPDIDGYFLMAKALLQAMQNEKWISDTWPRERILPQQHYRRTWGFTALDSLYASLSIRHLKGGWPFKKTGANTTLYRYKPVNHADSIALQILTKPSTLELGHLELADYYIKHKNYASAFEEYRALVYTVPNLDLFYEPALKLLLQTEQYEAALRLMQDALKYNESGFVYKWMGQLKLSLGETYRGIQYLKKARTLLPDDAQILYNLTRAYYNSRQINEGDTVLNQFKKLVTDKSAAAELEKLKRSVINEMK